MGKSFKIPWFQSPPTSNPFIDGISTYILGDTRWDVPPSICVKVSQVTGGGDLVFFHVKKPQVVTSKLNHVKPMVDIC